MLARVLLGQVIGHCGKSAATGRLPGAGAGLGKQGVADVPHRAGGGSDRLVGGVLSGRVPWPGGEPVGLGDDAGQRGAQLVRELGGLQLFVAQYGGQPVQEFVEVGGERASSSGRWPVPKRSAVPSSLQRAARVLISATGRRARPTMVRVSRYTPTRSSSPRTAEPARAARALLRYGSRETATTTVPVWRLPTRTGRA